ncbi:TPA: hypothetical protein KKW64_001169 [Legionella pneumophila]|nr:hypothetical protein [Legionella pneumophila]
MSDDKIRKQAEKLLSLAMILEDDFKEEAKNKIAYLDKVVVLLESLQTPLNNDYELMAICHRELASLYAAFFPKQEKQEEHYKKAVKFAQLSNSKNENIDFAHEVKQYIQQEVETHKSTLEFFLNRNSVLWLPIVNFLHPKIGKLLIMRTVLTRK